MCNRPINFLKSKYYSLQWILITKAESSNIIIKSKYFFSTLGELEFSDQDDFGNSGFQEIRVKPPPGFQEDLGLLGNKFSLNNNNNNNAEQDRSPNIQSSLGNQFNNAQNSNPFANFLQNQAQNQASSTATPNLPSFNPLAGFSQEQIQQLALLQFLQNNPALGFGFGLGQPQQQVRYFLKTL